MKKLAYTEILVVAAATSAIGATYVVNPDGTGDYATIQDAIDAAVDGDVIELGDGVFVGSDNISLSLLGKGVTIRSTSGDPSTCIIQGDGTNTAFVLWNQEPVGTTIQNISIEDSRTGVHIDSSHGAIIGCWLQGNETGIGLNPGATAVVRDCVISGSYWAMDVNFVADLSMSGTTIAGNMRGLFTNTTIDVEHSVVWGNCESSIHADPLEFASVRFTCCIVDSSNTIGGMQYLADNVFTNPLFCDPVDCDLAPTSAGEYTVDVLSPCLPQNNACGVLIGALGANCSGATPAIGTTWGGVKGRYR